MWKMLCLLEEFFGIRASCIADWSPPGAQGFLPHYEDVHTFIIQLEGSKKWKIFGPKNPNEILSRVSNPNIDPVN